MFPLLAGELKPFIRAYRQEKRTLDAKRYPRRVNPRIHVTTLPTAVCFGARWGLGRVA